MIPEAPGWGEAQEGDSPAAASDLKKAMPREDIRLGPVLRRFALTETKTTGKVH